MMKILQGLFILSLFWAFSSGPAFGYWKFLAIKNATNNMYNISDAGTYCGGISGNHTIGAGTSTTPFKVDNISLEIKDDGACWIKDTVLKLTLTRTNGSSVSLQFTKGGVASAFSWDNNNTKIDNQNISYASDSSGNLLICIGMENDCSYKTH